MNYFFILGNHPRLSIAEIESVFWTTSLPHENACAFFQWEATLDLSLLQKRLGGTIKIGTIHKTAVYSALADDITALILQRCAIEKKIFFGISGYDVPFDCQGIAQKVKQKLVQKGRACRWISSKEKVLSSVVVKTNKLLTESGSEIVIVQHKKKILLGITKTVQPFDRLGERDFGRPARDLRSGMLPPKLAQILINLAAADEQSLILDPFCGSGTIVQEALLMGYRNVIGSDVSKKAIEDTRKNWEWLAKTDAKEHYSSPILVHSDICALSTKLQGKHVDSIITEPYLGPPLTGKESSESIAVILNELTRLYLDFFKACKQILKPRGVVVIVFPIIRHGFLPLLEAINKRGFMQDKRFMHIYDNAVRRSFVYARPNQQIQREIFVFVNLL